MRAGIRSRPWAGIDVGSFSVKLIATQPGVGGVRYWIAEQALPALENGKTHAPDLIAHAIARCLELAGLSPRSIRGVTTGIAGSDVIVKQITMPLLDDAEVGPALRFEARKHLPFDPQGMIIDFQILGRFATQKKLEVLLAAVSAEHAEKHREPFRRLGLEADILDATPLALSNGLMYGVENTREGFLLLDIGHAASHLTLYRKGEPYFSRRLDFGGRSLTRAIAEGTKVPYEEAEEWKLAAGADQPGFRVDWDAPEMQAMHQALQTQLAAELRASFAFYRTMGELPDPLKVWVSGGSARLPGLAARLSELLGNPVLLFNPLEHFSGAPRGGQAPTVGPHFAQAFGLSLRSV
jgi:type IV pilus assembly protein PilM